MPGPCEAGYADVLAKEYLRTISGKTTENPFGFICSPGDVDEWQNSVFRLRRAFADAMGIAEREKIKMSRGDANRVAHWVFKSLKVPGGGVRHLSSRVCHTDVANAMDFTKRGVNLLADVHCSLSKGGATVPQPPTTKPPVKQLPGGSGIWYLGLVVLGLGFLAYLKPKKG